MSDAQKLDFDVKMNVSMEEKKPGSSVYPLKVFNLDSHMACIIRYYPFVALPRACKSTI